MTNLKVSTPVIRRVAFSSDTHLTPPKWEGLIICQILQNAFSQKKKEKKKSISSPKVTLRAESSFSSNTPWKSFPLLHFAEFWSQLPRWSLCLLLLSASPPHPPLFSSLSFSLSVSYLPQLSCRPSHRLCSVISCAVQMFHPRYSICSPTPSSFFLPPPSPPLLPLDLLVLH